MFPFAFEWEWYIGQYLFMGAAGFAISVVGLGLTYCIIKSIIDTIQETDGAGEHDHH